MSAEEELGEVAAEYRTFIAGGGHRGSRAGRRLRQRISDLVVQVKDARACEERVTEDDEVAHYANLDVFGE